MGKTNKGGATQSQKAGASSPSKAKGTGKRSMTVVDEEKRKKQRAEEEKHEKEDKKFEKSWKESVLKKKIKGERWIEKGKIRDEEVCKAIKEHGLDFFFNEMGKHQPKVVQNFYYDMKVVFDKKNKGVAVKSQSKKHTLEITPDTIASYLSYTRPKEGITFPRPTPVLEEQALLAAVTEDPTKYDGKSMSIPQGYLKPQYRFLNILAHHNLYPRGSLKNPTFIDLEILYVLGSKTETVDWARFIFKQMKQFMSRAAPLAKMPFPAMITRMWEDAKIPFPANDTEEDSKPGELGLASMRKSKTSSKQPSGIERPTATNTATNTSDSDEQCLSAIHKVIMEEQQQARARQEQIIEEQQQARARQEKIIEEQQQSRARQEQIIEEQQQGRVRQEQILELVGKIVGGKRR